MRPGSEDQIMRKSLYSMLLVAISFNVLWLIPAAAQEEKGVVAGTVRDSANAVLTGALVELQPTAKRAVTDDQGQYRITDVAPGQYTVTASYIGLASFTATVTVAAGQTASVDATLKVASRNDDVLVTAERLQGEAEAINVERTADNVVQVLPAKVITSLPNTNIADAVGRLPSVTLERDEGEGKYVQIRGTEPRLTNVTVNGVNMPSPEGDVRNIKLDTIPAALVDRIEVNKTLSANQDADGIGGSVNLATKTAGDRPAYSLEGMGGYTPIQGGRGLDLFSGTLGRRFGASKKFGFLLSGSYDWNGRGIDDLEPSPATGTDPKTGNNVAFDSAADLRTYQYYRTRYGFGGETDYNLSPGSNVYVRGLFADFHDYGETWVYSPNVGSSLVSVNGSQYTFSSDGFMQYRHYVRRPDQGVFSVSTGARHDLSSTLINYEFAVSRGHNYGGQKFATTQFYNAPSNINFGEDLSDRLKPQFPVLNGTNIYDPTQYSISNVEIPDYHARQLNLQGSASVARRYTVGGHFSTFELGFKVRNAHKTVDENTSFYNPASSTNIMLSQVLGSFSNTGYYSKAYQYGPMSDYSKINQLVLPLLGTGFLLDPKASLLESAPASYDSTERIYAGYLMNTISLGKARLQTGVRIEGTDATYLANSVDKKNLDPQTGLPTVTRVTGGGNYINVLPSIQLQYLIQQNTNIRGSFDMGLSRPNFADLVPTVTTDPNTSATAQVLIGNPALKPTRANNYDVLVEHYFQPLGIIQVGFFYKTLTNPIYQTTTRQTPADQQPFPSYNLVQSINGPSAHITGFEMAWEQRLSFLPGLLKGFGVAANYSYTTSRATLPAGFNGGRTDTPALQRQAPNTWNLGFTYDKARFSMRFDVSHNDANIFSYLYKVPAGSTPTIASDPILGLKGPTGDQYIYAHTQYDIQGSYRMYKGLQLVVYGLNLSNEVFGFYQGSPIYPIQREFYHPTVSAGMRWSLSPEQK
jgi:TonB-dependent receptor